MVDDGGDASDLGISIAIGRQAEHDEGLVSVLFFLDTRPRVTVLSTLDLRVWTLVLPQFAEAVQESAPGSVNLPFLKRVAPPYAPLRPLFLLPVSAGGTYSVTDAG